MIYTDQNIYKTGLSFAKVLQHKGEHYTEDMMDLGVVLKETHSGDQQGLLFTVM